MAETNLEPEKGSTSYRVTDKPKVRPAPIDLSAAQAMSISYDKTDRGRLASTPKSKLGHRRVDEKGETTYKKTPSSALMSAIQLGIGFTVGRLSAKQERDVLMQDFAEIETVWFPCEGTKGTPSHKFSDFKFKSYAPVAFRFFRELFHMKADDFMMSLCNDPLQELSNPGASGSLFYVTCDNQFIIKTVDHKEAEFLQKLLPGYYLNLNQNKKTLLPKFFSLFCYQCGGKNIRLVVMNNLLPTVYKFHWKYDLKGSTYKRRASKTERAKGTPTLKDLDFLTDHPEGIFLEPDTHSALIKTLQRDCRVLESFKIMDYSLLLAIHNLDEAQRERQQDGTLTPSGQMVSIAADQEKSLDKSESEQPEHAALQRTKSLKSREGFSSAWEAITVKETIERPYGGIPARNAKGERLLLFIGIIDILQSYRLKKKLEHGWKSMIHDGDTVSVHRPNFYSRRFLEFMSSKVFKKLPGKEKTSPRKRSLATSIIRQRSMTEGDRFKIEQRRERTQMGENTTRSYSRSFSERDRSGTIEAGATSSLQPKRISSENSKEASTESSENKELNTVHKDSPDSGVPPSPQNESVSSTRADNASSQNLTPEMTLTTPVLIKDKETSDQLESSVTNNHIDQESNTEMKISLTLEQSSSVSNTPHSDSDNLPESQTNPTSPRGRTLWDRPWSPEDDQQIQNENTIQAHSSVQN